jgi:phospholipid/cholesterol/gamma-HCH transport system substrate-binding protein
MKVGGSLIKLIIFAIVSIMITLLVVNSMLDLSYQSTRTYHATFTDASGLTAPAIVRIAGIEVGKVTGVKLKPVPGQDPASGNRLAEVSFNVAKTQHLTTTTLAAIHFQDLIGTRFLALIPGPDGGQPLHPGSTIPVRQTAPALDLTTLFNGFQPLFQALSPTDVNAFAGSIVQVLQGEASNTQDLVAKTAAIVTNLADRQTVIGQVIDNLSKLLGTLGANDRQLAVFIDSLDQLAGNLASQRGAIGDSITKVDGLANAVTGLLAPIQSPTHDIVSGLQQASTTLVANQQALDGAINGLPNLLAAFDRVLQHGSFLKVYVCDISLTLQGTISAADVLKALQADSGLLNSVVNTLGLQGLLNGLLAPIAPNLNIPGGPVGDQTQHTRTCQ